MLSVTPPRHQGAAVERHPQYEEIMRAMVAKQTDGQIASWVKPPLDKTTIWRFRKNRFQQVMQRAAMVPATVAQALQDQGLLRDTADISRAVKAVVQATVQSAAADPFIARMEESRLRRERMLAKAEEADDFRGFAALDRNDITALELHARLEHRLDAAPPRARPPLHSSRCQVGTPAWARPWTKLRSIQPRLRLTPEFRYVAVIGTQKLSVFNDRC
jgi:hypothetical protein